MRLTKQVPSGHRSLCIASQEHAEADNEAQGWEAPNCLISTEYSFSYKQSIPLDGKLPETIAASTCGQDRGSMPCASSHRAQPECDMQLALHGWIGEAGNLLPSVQPSRSDSGKKD